MLPDPLQCARQFLPWELLSTLSVSSTRVTGPIQAKTALQATVFPSGVLHVSVFFLVKIYGGTYL